MDDAKPGVGAASARAPQQRPRVFGERVLVAGLVGDRQHPGRLVDDDEVAIDKDDRTLRERTLVELGPSFVDRDDRVRGNARRRVQAALAVDHHASLAAELTRARPRGAGPLAND